MSLVSCRAAIAKRYRDSLKAANVTVLEHGGALDLEELKRLATRTPALIVALLGVQSVKVEGGLAVADAAWGIFPIAINTIKEKRDVAAAMLTETVLHDLPFQRWNAQSSGSPHEIAAANLYSSTLDKNGISLWAIRWRQSVDLVTVVTADLVDFLRLYTTYTPEGAIEDDTLPMEGHVDLEATT